MPSPAAPKTRWSSTPDELIGVGVLLVGFSAAAAADLAEGLRARGAVVVECPAHRAPMLAATFAFDVVLVDGGVGPEASQAVARAAGKCLRADAPGVFGIHREDDDGSDGSVGVLARAESERVLGLVADSVSARRTC